MPPKIIPLEEVSLFQPSCIPSPALRRKQVHSGLQQEWEGIVRALWSKGSAGHLIVRVLSFPLETLSFPLSLSFISPLCRGNKLEKGNSLDPKAQPGSTGVEQSRPPLPMIWFLGAKLPLGLSCQLPSSQPLLIPCVSSVTSLRNAPRMRPPPRKESTWPPPRSLRMELGAPSCPQSWPTSWAAWGQARTRRAPTPTLPSTFKRSSPPSW